jgi:peptidoglycan/LPS O-acetylase OafA/YrhL
LKQRIGQIDALRLFAALGVFVFHVSGTSGFPKRVLPPLAIGETTFSSIPSPFPFGVTGVSLFFVISGYCLYNSLTRRGQSVGEYYRSRVARIYPAYALAVLFSAGACLATGALVPVDVPIKLTFLQSFLQQYHISLNGALWSMGTEVQFYILLPAFIWLFTGTSPIRATISLVGFCLVYRLAVTTLTASDNPVIGGIVRSTFLTNMLPGRIAEFAIGMFVAAEECRLPRQLHWMTVPVLICALLVKAYGSAWLSEPLLGLGYGLLLFSFLKLVEISQDSWLARGGRASYSLFLFHWPVASLVGLSIALPDASLFARFAVQLTAVLILAFPLATAIYLFVELPAYRFLTRGSARLGAKQPAWEPSEGGPRQTHVAEEI